MPQLEPVSRHRKRPPPVRRTPTAGSDLGLRDTARGGTLNVVSAVCNQACLFLIVVAVARSLGESLYGEYALGIAMLTLAGVFSLFGFQMALARFVAIHLADGDNARLRGTIRLGVGFSVSLSVSMAIALAVAAGPIAQIFHHPEFSDDLRLLALALPAGTIRDACLAATQGWRTQRPFGLVTWVYEPAIRLSLTVLALELGYGLTGAVTAIVIGSWTAAALSGRALLVLLRPIPRADPIFEPRPVFGFSMVSFGTGLASLGLIWADLIMLGAMSTTADVGIYNVSTRLINLAVFIMLPINAAFGPHFAHLLHVGDFPQIVHAYAVATNWILRLSLPAFVLLVVFPDDLLHIFGPQYEIGVAVTVILSFGQLLNAATGPCGTLLNMGGRIRLNMINNIAVLILNIAMNFVLIPRYGMIGAAISWSFSLGLVNVTRVVQLRRIMHAMPFGKGTAKSLLAAGMAAVICVVVRAVVPGQLLELAVGVVCVLVAYIGTIVVLGVDPEDRQLAVDLLRRR